MIRVLCPHCKRRYRTERSAFGVAAICSACHRSFEIGAELAPFEWQPTDVAEDSWVGVAAPEPKKEIRHCIICEAPLPDEAVTCPACGVNQVTGVVHRAKTELKTAEPTIWAAIPWRFLLIASAIALASLGLSWIFHAIYQAAIQTTDTITIQAKVISGAQFLRRGGDEFAFSRQFSGRLRDDELGQAIKMLRMKDSAMRQSAELLIGCGHIEQVQPIIELSNDESSLLSAIRLLEAIGPRRLVELSNHTDLTVRQSAARALVLLLDLPGDEPLIDQLTRPMSNEDKLTILDEYCRYWPMLVGSFVAVIEGVAGDFSVDIEQVGYTFYVRIGNLEFRGPAGGERSLFIPLEYWCEATSPGVDAQNVRSWITGSIRLNSEVGAEWAGTLSMTAKQQLSVSLPGFLPFDPPPPGRTVKKPVVLRRP